MKKNEEMKKVPMPAPIKKTDLPIRRERALAPFFDYTPFNAMRRFTDEFEKMFDDLTNFNFMLTPYLEPRMAFPVLAELETPLWTPQIEVLEKKGQFLVRADLPGLKKEDINVELIDNFLHISGERNVESAEEREGFYRSEREYGNFFRRIPLPEGADLNNATATFENGVLEVMLHVPERKTKGRKLEIAARHEPLKAKAASAK